MNLRHKLQSKTTIGNLFDKHFENQRYVSEDSLHFLVDLVHLFRPKKPKKEVTVSIEKLLYFLEEHPDKRELLIGYLAQLFKERKFSRMLSDAAILQDADFVFEVKKRLLAKVLPYQPQKDTLQYILNQVFYLNSDGIWIKKVPMEELLRLFDLLSFRDIYVSVKDKSPLSELLNVM
ncbi:MAG: recombinase, partial [Flavobacterium sp.]|nr:recombinase [Flavobacterium sp.]